MGNSGKTAIVLATAVASEHLPAPEGLQDPGPSIQVAVVVWVLCERSYARLSQVL